METVKHPKEWEVDFIRSFSFRKGKDYIVREVLENPGIEMKWVWTKKIASLLNHTLETKTEKNHVFIKIEILTDITVEEKDLKMIDIICIGLTKDNRVLLLTTEKYKEAFSKSNLFKRFAKEIE